MNKLVPVEIVYIKKTSRSFYCIILPNFPLFFYFLNLVGRVRRPLRRQPEKPFHPCLHHTITTLGHHCRMCLPGSSPSGQKANRTKRLWWPKKKKKRPDSYLIGKLLLLCWQRDPYTMFFGRLQFPWASYWIRFHCNCPLNISNERCQVFDIFIFSLFYWNRSML